MVRPYFVFHFTGAVSYINIPANVQQVVLKFPGGAGALPDLNPPMPFNSGNGSPTNVTNINMIGDQQQLTIDRSCVREIITQ